MDYGSIFHNGHPVSHAHGFIKVVGNKENCLLQFFLQADQFVLHFTTDQRVKATERLIHEKDRRIHHKSPGYAYPLSHPTAEGAGIIVLPSFKANSLESDV